MLRMRLVAGLVAVCIFSAGQVHGQSTKAALDAFRDSVVDQQFVLRNFSGETKVKVAWGGTKFALGAPGWQTFGVLKVRSVKQKDEQIRLDCERHVLGWNGPNSLGPYPVVDLVQISIDLRGGDPTQLLPQLRDEIFFSSIADALPAIPKPLRKMVPAHENNGVQNATGMTKPCDCSEDDPCASVKGAAGFVFPKIVHAADPRFSDEGSRRKLNGTVVTAFMVDDKGVTHDVWITRPLGYGMDEQAAKAVFNYVFQPATCRGAPLSMPLGASINFQIF
jgi:hypothetical protein